MFGCEKIIRPENPILKSWCLSKMFFLWTIDIYRLGIKRDLEDKDVYSPLPELSSESVTDIYTKLWDEELKRENPRLIRAFLRGYGFQLISLSTMYSLTEASLRILLPICLGGLLSYFVPGQTEITRNRAFVYALSISGVTLLIAIIFHPFIFYVVQCSIKLQVGCCALLYRKVLKFSKSTTFDGMNGQVINLLSNDLAKTELGLCFHHDLWKGPMEAIVMGCLIYREIGIPGLIGMMFLLSFIPVQVWVGKKSASYHLKSAKRTDSRIKFMNEIIQAIQVIKMYTWEKSFAAIVGTIRRKETNSLRGAAYGRAAIFSFQVISRIAIFLSFSSYIYFGEVITARKVFIVSSYFMSLSNSMVFFWPMAITEVLDALISLNRIENFLLQPEVKPSSFEEEKKSALNLSNKEIPNGSSETTKLLPRNRTHNINSNDTGIIINNLTATWSVEDSNNGVFLIDFEVQPNKLCTIIGPVGSGKTTLLNVIIGELEHDSGFITIEGSLSYASQEPWLFVGTIKQNIVFTEKYDPYRYRDVCRVCALEKDFELLPFGDKTMVSERGVNLSGGQRARVNLARSVYRNADIYLLDDPLSAVDVKVGKQIYNQCIQNYLKQKCVVLVTHQIQFLKNSEHIVLFNNGRIEAQGNYDFVKSKKQDLIMEMISPHEDENVEKTITNESEIKEVIIVSTKQEDENKETLTKGTVSISTYKTYLNSVENKFTTVFALSLFTLSVLMVTGVDYFLAQWCNWEELIGSIKNTNITIDTNNVTTNFSSNFSKPLQNLKPFLFSTATEEISIRYQYILTYLILVLMMIYLVVHRNFTFFKMCITISVNLHDRLFRGVSRATMLFFNTNQSGWILNRFSKDIGTIDSILPQTLLDSIICFLEILSMGLIVCIINPWLLIPTTVIGGILFLFRRVYLTTSRSLNRLQAISRSPIYAHTNTTIQGLSTIKSFKAENELIEKFNEYLNSNTGAFFLFRSTARTFGQWVDIVSAVYVIFITFSCLLVFSGDKLGGDVGLIISKGLLFLGMLQWGLRQSADLENHMISVERVQDYINLAPEANLETLPANIPKHEWPPLGEINFYNLSLRYAPEKPYILKGLNLSIKPKEKIGIIGRTGAGKSSIIQALFRLTEPEGKIEIDGVDIQTLGLHDLRKQISIIPQDPVLFSGTMRNNLDPFHEKLDDDLWSVLEEVQLKKMISQLAGGLDSKMLDGGSNFSMGQRQLVCLARAILRHNKILILDEATANVDSETDKLIQTTIRTKFVDCTVLTIAHRLHTVLDNDRILVMDDGRIIEFDSPHVLLQNPNSYSKKLFDEAGIDLYKFF